MIRLCFFTSTVSTLPSGLKTWIRAKDEVRQGEALRQGFVVAFPLFRENLDKRIVVRLGRAVFPVLDEDVVIDQHIVGIGVTRRGDARRPVPHSSRIKNAAGAVRQGRPADRPRSQQQDDQQRQGKRKTTAFRRKPARGTCGRGNGIPAFAGNMYFFHLSHHSGYSIHFMPQSSIRLTTLPLGLRGKASINRMM
jgi:hypothetical protein